LFGPFLDHLLLFWHTVRQIKLAPFYALCYFAQLNIRGKYNCMKGLIQVKSFLACTYPLLIIPLFLFQATVFAQFTDEESGFYIQKGIIPFIDKQQDGDYPKGIYLVPHDLTVDSGKVMTVMPGSTILFKKDTKIIVKGKLVLKGNKSQRIMLRKLDHDMYYNPFPPDIEIPWDGIYVHDGGELEARYTHICDSKYGLSATRNASIFLLDSVLFHNNKYHNVTLGGKSLTFEDNKLCFYDLAQNKSEPIPMVYVDTVKLPQYIPSPQPVAQSPSTIETGKKQAVSERKVHLRVTSGVFALAGIIMGAGSYYVNDTYYKKYDRMRTPGVDNPEEVRRYENFARIGMAGMISGAALTAIGLSGLTLTFLF
jgi:hypothetical protein